MNTSKLVSIVTLVAAGVLLGQFVRADAQTAPQSKGFHECFAARTWQYAPEDVNTHDMTKKTLKVPPGWSVVGGGGHSAGDGIVILCR
jgi:hypothetical protein